MSHPAPILNEPRNCPSKQSRERKRIYLSGPFFNESEIANVEYVEKLLDGKGLTYFSPMRHGVDEEPGTAEWARKVFELDRDELRKADAIVALYYGNYSDSGTAWECGYAVAQGVPVILVHVDESASSNLMMHCSAATNVFLNDLAEFDFETMPAHEYTGEMF